MTVAGKSTEIFKAMFGNYLGKQLGLETQQFWVHTGTAVEYLTGIRQ